MLRKTMASPVSFQGVMAAINPLTFNSTHQIIFQTQDVGNLPQTSIVIHSDGSLSAWSGSTGSPTVLGTTAPAVLTGSAFQHIEAQVKIDSSVGTVDIWVAGINVLSLTGKNTKGAVATTSTASFVQLNDNTVSAVMYFDDVVFYDATSRSAGEHFGDLRVQTLLPTGTGTGIVGTWSQTGGTGGQTWTAVNETPDDGDTSYQSDATVNDVITFLFGSLATNPSSIPAIACNMIVRKDDATARQVATVIRTSTNNQIGATVNTPSSYACFQTISTVNPTTSAAWATAGVNALEAGIKVIS